MNAAITALLDRFQSEEGLTRTTIKALDALREIARKRRAGLPWSDWARLAKLGGATADDLYFEPLRKAASVFPRHPRLLEDVGQYIDLIFACAGEAYLAYEEHKRQWGQVDFVDQERIALRLFNDPELAASLVERIERFMSMNSRTPARCNWRCSWPCRRSRHRAPGSATPSRRSMAFAAPTRS